VDLSSSSNEECLIADMSHDEEFARRLFGDLNHDFLGPLSDGKIIILSDSDEKEEEVCEEKTDDVKTATSSAARSPAPTTSTVDADDTDKGDAPDRVICDSSAAEMKPACLRLPRQGGACRKAFFKENFKGCPLLHHKFFYKEVYW
jgi:hypothetical protein